MVNGLAPLVGHHEVRRSLATAIDRGDLPGSLLIHGPRGVGKQRLGLWLAQRILCEAPGHPEPCGRCTSCRAILRLEHPDVHWYFPLPRPKSVSADRLAAALEDARAAELAERRSQPYRASVLPELAGHYVQQVQTLRRAAFARPAAGEHKVFLLGDAELLVPQESSPEAANAMLKVLEEPPSATTFILTACEPDELLPTIRSRLLPVRLRPLPESTVVEVLISEMEASPANAAMAARLGSGSIGRALGFLPAGKQPGPLEVLRQQARAWLEAAASPTPGAIAVAAHRLATSGARGSFGDALELLALWIRDLAAYTTEARDAILNVDSVALLDRLARRFPGAASGAADAIACVDVALRMARSNVNPQLTLAWLLAELRAALVGETTGQPVWQSA